MLRTALLCFVVGTSSAAAAEPLALTVAAGYRQQSLHGELQATPQADAMSNPKDTGAALEVMAGYRIMPGLVLGARFGVSRIDVEKEWGRSSSGPQYDGYLRTPIDTALVVQVEYSRLWLAPWIGVQAMHAVDQARSANETGGGESARDLSSDWSSSLSFGADAGVDVVQYAGNRVTVFAGAQSGTGGYSAFTVGLGYRR
jgi:hypothetical protein